MEYKKEYLILLKELSLDGKRSILDQNLLECLNNISKELIQSFGMGQLVYFRFPNLGKEVNNC